MGDEPHFHDEAAARAFLQTVLWTDGPVCPHCGGVEYYAIKKPGAYRCVDCEKDYSVTVGTVMERSHIKLHKWLRGFWLVAANKKVSAMRLHRDLGVTYKAAWFMKQRLYEALRAGLMPPHVPQGYADWFAMGDDLP